MKRLDRPLSPIDSNYFEKGNANSGNRGHKGRPGQRGGSAPRGEGGDVVPAVPKTEQFTFKPASNVVEAMEYTKSLGVLTAYFLDSEDPVRNLEMANRTNEALTRLANQGHPMPGTVMADKAQFVGYAEGAIGMYDIQKDTIFLNTDSPVYADREQAQNFMNHQYEVGWMSSNNLDHVVYHELGHMAHSKSDYGKFKAFAVPSQGQIDLLTKAQFTGKVSNYALTSKREFVAEVFAGHTTGKRYSNDVYERYEVWGGPRLNK